jgi:hypothetical protein
VPVPTVQGGCRTTRSVLGNADIKVATAFYALVGTLLMTSWVVFDSCVVRHPGLIDEGGSWFFRQERRKALLGVVLFPVGGLLGYVSPWIALAIFLAIPLFYGITAPRE